MRTSFSDITTPRTHLPMAYAKSLGVSDFVLLHSAHAGEKSLLFYDAQDVLEYGDAQAIRTFIGPMRTRFDLPVAGFIGYEWGAAHEKRGWLKLPPMLLIRFKSVAVFDHARGNVTFYGREIAASPAPSNYRIDIESLHTLVDDASYLAQAQEVIHAIAAGRLYQANLTRKYTGRAAFSGSKIDAFAALCNLSPTRYSAYMQARGISIFSASPECFLTIADGCATSRPIKGTAPRNADAGLDATQRGALLNSEKNRAENLMIVDLMRNDLSKTCQDVRADSLFEITSHAQVHHMSSTVSGALMRGKDAVDVTEAAFPPGSMTGAPKHAAIQMCKALEPLPRGVYSGALGWFGGDGSADLSVVIRTLIYQNNRFEYQVGGGIVADSTPEGELAECFAKAKTMDEWLQINTSRDTGRLHIHHALARITTREDFLHTPNEATEKAGVLPIKMQGREVLVYLMRPPAQRLDLGPPELQIGKGTRMFFDVYWQDCPIPPHVKSAELEPLIITALREAEEEFGLKPSHIANLTDVGDVTFTSASSGKAKAMRLFLADNPAELENSTHAQWVKAPELSGVRPDHALLIRELLKCGKIGA